MSTLDTREAGSEEPPRGDVIYVADASVEGEEVAGILRGRGYHVVDIPFALLDAHVLTSPPKVLVLDVDQPKAVAMAMRILASPVGPRIALLCVGDPLRAGEIFGEGSGAVAAADNVFERPVDVQRLTDRVSSLATPSGLSYVARGTTPPPMYASRHSVAAPASDSAPPISEIGSPADPLDMDALLPALDEEGALGTRASLSADLLAILEAAERRVAANAEKQNGVPVSDEDPDCRVPPEMLSPLDEPLDALDEGAGTGAGADGTGGSALGPFTDSAIATGGGASSAGGSIGPGPQSITALPLGAVGHLTGATSTERTGTSTRGGALTLDDPQKVPTGIGVDARSSPPAELPHDPASSRQFSPSPEKTGYPYSMLGPAALGVAAPNPQTLALRRELSALGALAPDAQSPAPEDDAPVRFQEARPVAEGGRSAIARALEDRARQDVPSRRSPITPLGFAALGSPGADSRSITSSTISSSTLGDLQRALASEARPPSAPEPERPPIPSVTDTSPRGRAPITAGSTKGPRDTGAMPMVYAELEGARPLARAIATRHTGAIALTVEGAARRIVLQDGDIVTAASERPDESLVSFLAERGDIDRETAQRLDKRLPPFGRHAGAALIAQGYLAQDDLWPVLRAHAEWVIGRALSRGPGTVELEDEAQGRLKAEPSVFGGATGAEVFVEVMRRVIAAPSALVKLGGPAARLDQGQRPALLGECALGDAEQALVRAAPGRSIGELLPASEGDLATVLWALVELGVLGVHAPSEPAAPEAKPAADPIDEEAVRQKIRARVALVREGDYFSLLGVPRTATAYDIKRAYLELRRAYEPSRLLTAATVDLLEDVKLVIEVLDEAYDILRDGHRRERYRRAIEASPHG